jgi:hypothetical protein
MSQNATQAVSPEELEAAAAAQVSTDPLADAQAELVNLKAQNADLADQYLRAQADVQNARRRADDEITKARKFAVESFADSLLPVLDSLEAGLAIPNVTIEKALRPPCASSKARWSATKWPRSTPSPGPNSTRTTTKPSAWCLLSKKPTPWSRCCKKAI